MPDELKSRPCTRCGQEVDPMKDSWNTTADGLEHAVCPTSPEMRDLPSVTAAPAARPQFLRMEDAAKMLAVSVDTIRRRIRSGELPARRLKGTAGGGRETILIDQADVLNLLEPYTGAEVSE